MASVKEFWQNLQAAQKFSFVVGTFLIVGISVFLLSWAMKPTYSVLFTDLAEGDAAAVMEKLEELEVSYQLKNGGSTVLVPDDLVYETRLRLTSAGTLMKNGVGFELFDQAEYGMTDFAQKINFQRALQGELSRTITGIEKIKHARVHLVLPESSLFRKKDVEPSASVTLILAENARLTAQEVNGIQHLIAASVQDLTVENIVIVDNDGTVLSDVRSSDSVELEDRLSEKQQVENYLKEKVEKIVNEAFGEGASTVNVDATINYDKVQKVVETPVPIFNNEGDVQVRKINSSRTVRPVGLNNVNGESTSNGNRDSITENNEREYVFGKSIEESILQTGNLSKLSISVLLPGDVIDGDKVVIRRLITAAVGLDESRGDVLEIDSIQSVGHGNQSSTSREAVGDVSDDVGQPTGEVDNRLRQSGSPGLINIGGFSFNILYLLYVLIALCVFLFLIVVFGGSKKERTLGDDERQQLLNDIRVWLRAEGKEEVNHE